MSMIHNDPLFAPMPAALAAIVNARTEQLLNMLDEDAAAMIAAGASHNDIVSALAHWCALLTGTAQQMIVLRAVERFGEYKDNPEIALDIFQRDVANRTRLRRAEILAEDQP
jgi:hypothetical protein